MTISSTVRKAGPYRGTGLVSSYPFNFKVFQASDVLVLQTDTQGNTTTLALTSAYTVTLNADQNGNPGGNVVLNSALPSGYTLTIGSQVQQLQSTQITNNGGFYPAVITDALDRLTILVQQQQQQVGNALQLSLTTPAGVSTQLPAPVASKIIGWNGAGNGLQNVDPTTLATIVAFGTANRDFFTGDGSTTIFTLSANPGAQANLDVDISGVTQAGGVDFTWSGGQTLTFAVAPPNGSRVQARYFQGLPQGTADWYALANNPFVDPKRFGAKGDGVTDDTAALQAAINYCITNKKQLSNGPGSFLISSSLQIYNTGNLTYENFTWDLGGSTILASPSATITALIDIKDAQNCHIKNGVLDGNSNLNVTAGIRIWSDGATSQVANYMMLHLLTAQRIATGFLFGNVSYPDVASVSEIILTQCVTIDVARPLVAYGVQTEVNCVGCNITSNVQSWGNSITNKYAITAVGASVRMTGGEVTAYTAAALNIQPINSPTYGLTYGAIRCVGTWLEVQSQYGLASNPNSLVGTYATAFPNGVINLQQCQGYLADDTTAAFDCASLFPGEFRIANCSFWAGVSRSHVNINGDYTYTKIYSDSRSFGINFAQGLAGLNGGTGKVYYDSVVPVVAVSVTQSTLQTVPNGAWTKVQLQNRAFDTDNAFDAATNYRFQPTIAGYYQINGNVQVQTTAVPCGLDIYKNGSSTGYVIGGFQSGVLYATATISRLVYLNGSTDYVELYCFQSSGGAVSSVTGGVTQFSASYQRAA